MSVEQSVEMRLASLVQTQIHKGNILPFQPSRPKARTRPKSVPAGGAHVSINSTGNTVLVGSYNTVTINVHGAQHEAAPGSMENAHPERPEDHVLHSREDSA